jgi:hypothetical protein
MLKEYIIPKYTVPKAHEEVSNILTYGLGAKPYITN